MEREEALSLIQRKEWDRLMEALKDNRVFEHLISDPIFVSLFQNHFIKELLSEQDYPLEDQHLYLAAIFNFHKVKSYRFELNDQDLQNILVRLYQITGHIEYAKEKPDLPEFKEAIVRYNKRQKEKNRQITISENLLIEEIESTARYENGSIFKSPQEKEFYLAARAVFPDQIVLPNVSLAMILSPGLLSNLENDEKWFFFTSSIDLVIVNTLSFKPIYFFELDSEFHDKPNQIKKDNLKNRLVSESGNKLYRIRKKHHRDQTQVYIDWLNAIKSRDDR